MELLQLRYFLTAAKYQHMTKAAEALQIAQPALSQSIKRLESELGVLLFDRENRGIRLNEAGLFLEKQLTPIMAVLDELPVAVREKAVRRTHTIHLNLLAASRLVTDCLISYKKNHPEISFRLWQSPDPGQEDLCISTVSPGERKKENSLTILRESFYLAVPSSSKYAFNTSIRLSEVKEEGFISLSGDRPIRRICDRFCLESGFTPHIICESDNPESVRSLIAAGFGIGFWPEYSWGPLSSSQIRLLPIENPVCQRDIIMTVHPGEDNSEVITDFCRFLLHYAENAR